jgi:protein-disulfide isomerase
MHRFLSLLSVLLLLAGLAGAQQKQSNSTSGSLPEAPGSLPSEATVDSFMHQMFGYDTSLTWRILSIRPSEAEGLAEVTVYMSSPQGQQTTVFFVSPDGKHAIVGQIIPFGAHPFLAAEDTLKEQADGPSRGPANAPVTLVEFADLQCPHCKEAQPLVDQLLSQDTNVRVLFENFPLPMHDWAMKAAEYDDCIGRASNDAFWKFVQGVYAAQSDITAANADQKLTEIADQSGVKGSDMAACAAQPETVTRVQQSIALGKSLGVDSTPTGFINGRKLTLGGIPVEVLKQLVDFAAQEAGQK